MDYFTIKRGDTRPPIKYQCLNDDGTPRNLTGETVRFKMRLSGQVPKVNAPATILDAPAGIVQYGAPWATTDTDTAGEYQGEFEATSGSGVETFPDHEYIGIRIMEDV